jgi:hypothetical protein
MMGFCRALKNSLEICIQIDFQDESFLILSNEYKIRINNKVKKFSKFSILS